MVQLIEIVYNCLVWNDARSLGAWSFGVDWHTRTIRINFRMDYNTTARNKATK